MVLDHQRRIFEQCLAPMSCMRLRVGTRGLQYSPGWCVGADGEEAFESIGSDRLG